MAITPRSRKRVRAVPRAPDGSAFQNCHVCGVSVAISLADMHECEPSQKVKRFRGVRLRASPNVKEGRFSDQPRSAFCFFMEKFKNKCKNGDPIEIDRKGFETWKNMSMEERQPYIRRAARVNYAYDKALFEELNKISKPKDEANVAFVDPWEDCSGSGWHTYVDEDEDDTALDPWEDCSGSGWHTYVPENDEKNAAVGKCDPWEDCSGSGWHTYAPEEDEVNPNAAGKSDPPKDEANAGVAGVDPWEDCSGSGWHTYVASDTDN